MDDPGLVHVQPELQTVFVHVTAFFSHDFGLCFGTHGDKHKVIGIAAVRYSGFPLPVFFNSSTLASLDYVIPVPAILSAGSVFFRYWRTHSA